jgi:ADP-heptose:LPS heptosyltransferase
MKNALIIRSAAMGDVISAEPIIRALYENHYDKIAFQTHEPYKSIFENHPLISPPEEPMEIFNLDGVYEKDISILIQDAYLRHIGIEINDKLPKLYLTEEEKSWASSQLDFNWVILDIGYPNGPLARGYWVEDWEPIVEFIKSLNFKVIQTSNRDVPCIVGITKDMRKQTNLRQLFALISCCKLYVGMDCGTMHAAQALGIPGVAIFNKRHPADKLCPIGTTIRAVHRANTDCFDAEEIKKIIHHLLVGET